MHVVNGYSGAFLLFPVTDHLQPTECERLLMNFGSCDNVAVWDGADIDRGGSDW